MRRCRKSHETKEHLPDMRSITEQRMKAVDGGRTRRERLCPWRDQCWSPYGQGRADGRRGSGAGCASTCWKGPAPPVWINHSCVWCSRSQTWLRMSHPGIQLKGGSEDFPAGPVVESPPANPGDAGVMLAGPWTTPGLTVPWRTPGQRRAGRREV